MNFSLIIILLLTVVCIVSTWVYFRRFSMPRPPIGVYNLGDVFFTMVSIVLVPFVYIHAPLWLAFVLLIISSLSVLSSILEPVVKRPALIWLLILSLLGVTMGVGFASGTKTPLYLVLNNLHFILMIIGVTNLWSQSGLKSRDTAVLAGLLALYDLVFTSQLSVMSDMVVRLDTLPLAPMLAWGSGGDFAAIGFGDLMMASVFPLTMLKGYGKTAGLVAVAASIGAILFVLVLPVHQIFPVMVILSPVIIVQYLYWNRRKGSERTLREYRLAVQ